MRSERLAELENHPPKEFYHLKQGQFYHFVFHNCYDTPISLELLHCMSKLEAKLDFTINYRQTENPDLMDCVVYKKNADTIIIGDHRNIKDFINKCFGDENDFKLDLDEFDKPAIVIHIEPNDDSDEPNCDDDSSDGASHTFICPYMNGGHSGGSGGMQMLTAQGNQPTEMKLQNDLMKILSQCVKYGYDIDLLRLKNTAIEQQRKAKDYKLKLDIHRKQWLSSAGEQSRIDTCEIYIVGDNKQYHIELPPAEKALYITSIYEGGFYLQDPNFGFLEDLSAIFSQMPDHQTRQEGIVVQNPSTSGITVMKKNIRDAISKAIGYGEPAIDLFAIEGYRGEAVSVRKATEDHVQQIKEAFKLKPES